MTSPQLPIITQSMLLHDLSRLGVQHGQTIMLHASVRAIGWVVGGPDMVLRTLLDVLTPDGALMMVASWEDNPYDLSRWPPERQRAYLEECPAFDPATSRADHRQMSILAEYLRTWPGAYRSTHPLASFVAVGSQAHWLTDNQPLQYGLGPGSPLARLCEIHGHILLLGSPFATTTLLHYAEHIAQIPNKRIDRYKAPIWQNGQKVWIDIEEYDTVNGIVDWDAGDYFDAIMQDYRSSGRGNNGTVGMADSYLFEAADVVAYAVDWIERHLK